MSEKSAAGSASFIECESHIEEVAVYARGAVVTRKVHLPETLPDTPLSLLVSKITAFCDLDTFGAELFASSSEGAPRSLVALRPRLVMPKASVTKDALLERAREALLARVRLKLLHAHLQKRRDHLAALLPDPGLFRGRHGMRHPEARTLDALGAGALIGAELSRLDARLGEIAREIEKNRLLQEAIDAEAKGAREGENEYFAQVSVVIELGAGGPISGLSLSYAVSQARWAPMYRARFSEGGKRVALGIFAMVAQESGEHWPRVKLSLSTADRIGDATLPKLNSLRLGRSLPPPERGYRPAPEGLDSMFSGYEHFVESLRPSEEERRQSLSRPRAKEETQADEVTRAGFMVDARSQMTADELQGPKTTPGMPTLHSADRGMMEAHTPAPKALAMGMARPGEESGTMPRTEPAAGFVVGGGMGGGGGEGAVPLAEQTLAAAVSMPSLRSKEEFRDEPSSEQGEEGGGGPEMQEPRAPWPSDVWLDFDALIMPDISQGTRRGKLAREPVDDLSEWPMRRAAEQKARLCAKIFALPLPKGAFDPWLLRQSGFFDVRYACAGRADLPSDGHFRQVPVLEMEADARMRFVSVPKESAAVYREAEIQNPFALPLLAGPVELFFDQAFVARTSMSHVDRGGTLVLGLGVEQRLRIARHAKVEESSAGLLGGSTVVDHYISIELASALGHDISVIVVDRIPVSDDKDVELKFLYAKPPAESYTQADRGAPVRRAIRWIAPLGAGAKTTLEFRYKVTLPSKSELLGGNRRES